MKKYQLLLLMFVFNVSHADTVEKSGDVLSILLPVTALSTAYLLDDIQGQKQYIKAFVLNGAITYALKFSTHKTRPDGSDEYSFPSGHTSLAFNAATFIHLRYGLKYGIGAYIAAAYVGYTRVASQRHYIEDVIAGAAVGSLSAWILTSPYDDISVQPIFSKNYQGIKLSYNF